MKQYKITYNENKEELLIAYENSNCVMKVYRFEDKKINNLEAIAEGLEAVGFNKIN